MGDAAGGLVVGDEEEDETAVEDVMEVVRLVDVGHPRDLEEQKTVGATKFSAKMKNDIGFRRVF